MKRILIILLTIHCSLFTINSSAQLKGQARIDSLLKELARQKEDTQKLKVLNRLVNEQLGQNNEEATRYARLEMELSEKIGWDKGIGISYNDLGMCYSTIGEYGNALECYEKALKRFEKIGNKRLQIGVLRSISDMRCEQNDFAKAVEAADRSLKLAEDLGDKERMSEVLNSLGIVYLQQSLYPKALEYFFKSLAISTALGEKEVGAGTTCNIGLIYASMNELSKALEYFLKALAICEKYGYKQFAANICTNTASAYTRLKDYPKALEYCARAVDLNEKLGNKLGAAGAIYSMGEVYQAQKEYAMAIDCLQRSATLAKAMGDSRSAANALAMIGGTYLAIVKDTAVGRNQINHGNDHVGKNYVANVSIPNGRAALLAAAIDYGKRSLVIINEINAPIQLQEVYEILAEAYRLAGDYKKALEASENSHAIKDSVFSKENKEQILKLGMKNDYDRQRLADSLKTAEKEQIAAITLQKQKSYTYLGIAGIMLLAGFSFFIVKERGKSETARKQSDGLLLNILPEEVAEELKSTGTTTAKHYDNVTVLFTDFVNFTQAAEQMNAQGLIDELHECFKAFDEITSKYNIEKIKTIGDAYLAVCGLPTADPKHAENVVRAAIEINAFMQDRLGKMGSDRTFAIRIGIHSGSVVAGIVGVKKFAYDIWGDTVNTAARMEQHGEAGKINISQTTYELVKDKFSCEYRGEVEAKGKGVMKMYFVG
jgi:class 3 adenylate cyclase